jgi:hypothetical protein
MALFLSNNFSLCALATSGQHIGHPASGKMALRATAAVLIFSLVFISASADEWGDWQDGRATY